MKGDVSHLRKEGRSLQYQCSVRVRFLTRERFPAQISWQHNKLISLLNKSENIMLREHGDIWEGSTSVLCLWSTAHLQGWVYKLMNQPALCAFLKFSMICMQIARPLAPGDVSCPVSCSHSREDSLSFRAWMFEQLKRFLAICNWQLGRFEAEDWLCSKLHRREIWESEWFICFCALGTHICAEVVVVGLWMTDQNNGICSLNMTSM